MDAEIARLRAELDSLKDSESIELIDLRTEIARLRAEIDAKSAEIVELQTELHRLRPVADQVDELRAEIAELQDRFSEGRTQLMAEIARYQAADCQRILYKSERDEARTELAETRTALAPLDAVVHELGIEDCETSAVETIRGLRDELAQERQLKQQLNDAWGDRLAGAHAAARSDTEEILRLSAEFDEIECRYEAHIDEIMRHNSETIARLREALETSSTMMKALAVQLESWGHESVVNYRGQLAANAAALAHLPQEEPSR